MLPSRRNKLAAIAVNRRAPAAACSSSSSPHRQASISHPQAKPSDGRPPFCIPTSNLCKLSSPRAASPTSTAKPYRSSNRNMASSEAKTAVAIPSSSLKRPNLASPRPRIRGDAAKSAGPPPLRRRPAASAPLPKKDAAPASARRRASQAPVEGKQGVRDSGQHGQPANKIRREKIAVKGKRGGFHISDLPSRRRALTYIGHPPKIELQLKRCSFDDVAAGFSLLNLENYLKQAWYPKDAMQTAEDVGSPGSLLSAACKSKP